MKIKNYILTYIDSQNKELILNSSGDATTLESKPLYKSLPNAKKAQKMVQNNSKKSYRVERLKHWRDEVLKDPKRFSDTERKQFLKAYLDLLKIQKYGVIIREVDIIVNMEMECG